MIDFGCRGSFLGDSFGILVERLEVLVLQEGCLSEFLFASVLVDLVAVLVVYLLFLAFSVRSIDLDFRFIELILQNTDRLIWN